MSGTSHLPELVGNAVSLDFVNTVNNWNDPERDNLPDFDSFLRWSEYSGLLEPARSQQLARQAQQEPDLAAAAFDDLIALRALLYRVFSNVSHTSQLPEQDLAQLTQWQAQGIASAQLYPAGESYQFAWNAQQNIQTPLWMLTADAVKILTSVPRQRLKSCPTCGWVFHDTSKNAQRRWCSMNTCGVRDKMRRYYRRVSDTDAKAPPDLS